MRSNKLLFVCLVGMSLFCSAALATPTNVALGKPVNLVGSFFVGEDSWSLGSNGTPASVVDEVYLGEGDQWNHGSVWWNTRHANPIQAIEIDLGSSYDISSLIVQADNNDSYDIQGWDGSSWTTQHVVPNVGGIGLTTRDPAAVYFTASKIRILAGATGDVYRSISEIEVVGPPTVPAPGAALLGTLGIGLVGWFRKRRAI